MSGANVNRAEPSEASSRMSPFQRSQPMRKSKASSSRSARVTSRTRAVLSASWAYAAGASNRLDATRRKPRISEESYAIHVPGRRSRLGTPVSSLWTK